MSNTPAVMVDWLTAIVPIRHKAVDNGVKTHVDGDGVIQYAVTVPKKLEGSFESSINIKTNDIDEFGFGNQLYISGNPTKFLQGHNVIGPACPNLLILRTLQKLETICGFTLDELTVARINRGDYIIKRIDINCMYELPSLSDVRAFIDAAGMKSRTRHGRCSVKKGTFYYGKNSKRWSIKGYSKFDEIMKGDKGHRLPAHLFNSPLLSFTENKLRLELVLRAPELKKITDRDNPTARQLLSQPICDLFNDYIARIDMSAQVSLKDEQLLQLPRKVQGTYALWRQGFDVRSTMANGTFYRHKELLKQCDIDISMPCEQSNVSNVVPLIRVIEAKPVTIPTQLLQYVVH